MIYKRFEELPVWDAAIELAIGAYELAGRAPMRRHRSLRDQVERASVSVSNNIAEGFERGTNQELLTFLFIASGSAGEVRSMLCPLERVEGFRELNSAILGLKAQAESASKQLGAWIRAIQNSEKKGERYMTDKVRRTDRRKHEREEFLVRLRKTSGWYGPLES